MNRKPKRVQLLEYYYSLQLTAQQTNADIMMSENLAIEYAMDYSAFYDGIAHRTRPRNAMDAVSGQLYSELINAPELPFSAYITGPTFLEVVDGFLKNIDANKSHSTPDLVRRINLGRDTIQNIRSQANPGNSHIIDLRQEYIDKELAEIDALVGKNVNEEVGRAKKLLGSHGPVKGLGDMHQGFADGRLVSTNLIQKKFTDLKDSRWKRDVRSDSEKEFRYLVDAINMAAVESLAPQLNNSHVTYVTRASQTEIMREGTGRTPLVPLYWLKAVRNQELLSTSEQAGFFEMLASNAKFIYNGILTRTTVPEGDDLILELADTIEPLLARLDGVDAKLSSRRETDEYYRLSADRGYASEARDRNIAIAEQKVLRLWKDYNSSSADDLIERGGIERLEYYQELTDKLRTIKAQNS